MNYATIIISLLGGLAIFLYSMQMMSSGLEATAGNRMKKILEKLTSNRVVGVGVGAGITAVIQSSSATTVMTVGFVNSKLMTLNQAVWVIMGANIGTTITGQLVALDIGLIAPILAFIGASLIVFFKKPKLHNLGHIIAGLGFLFIGMKMMSDAMKPLAELQSFKDMMTSFSNPVIGILIGIVFTAVIQSSSAAVGILQILAASGLIGFENAIFVLFGTNIGTCITAVLASIGTSRAAKRTTIIHLMFNVIGTVIFTILALLTPIPEWIGGLSDAPKQQLANMHTIFNVTTTLILLPFGTLLAKFATLILPDKETEHIDEHYLEFIKPLNHSSDSTMGTSVISMNGIKGELERMTAMTVSNIEEGFTALINGDTELVDKVEKGEEYVDYLNKEISKYISSVIAFETNENDSRALSAFFKICSNVERISDHAMNICGYTKHLADKGIKFSEEALKEIDIMQKTSLEAMSYIHYSDENRIESLSKISSLEQKIDDLTDTFRRNQIDRMKSSSCNSEAGIIYSEMLTDFERIGDHILNIGEEIASVSIA